MKDSPIPKRYFTALLIWAAMICLGFLALSQARAGENPPPAGEFQSEAEVHLRGLLSEKGVNLDAAAALSFSLVLSGPVEVEDFKVSDDELPFDQAQRIVTRRRTDHPSDALVKWEANQQVEEGDVILVRFWMRSRDMGEDVGTPPTPQFYIKQADTGQLARGRQTLGGQWVQNFRHARMPGTTDDWWMEFFVGHKQQEFDIAGLTVLNLGPDVDPDNLPETQLILDYDGREEGAPWRAEARQRIEELRMANMALRILDRDGQPIPDARVQIEMQRHHFPFGAAVAVPWINNDGVNPEDAERYRQVLLDKFDVAVIQNALKQPAWDGRWAATIRREKTFEAIDWLEKHGMPIRGHTLLWSSFNYVNVDTDMSDEQIHEKVKEQIREKAEVLRGRIYDWDMHNHPIAYAGVWRHIGREHLLEYWQLAREIDPDARMAINEGQVLVGGGRRLEAYEEHIRWLLENDAPVDAIGFMSHFSATSVIRPEDVLARLNRFAEFGLPLFISEFDINVDRDREEEVELQRDFTRDFMIACFSHPSVDTFISWNFWEGRHWRPNAAYYNMDWSLRPNGEAYMDLVFNEWWTQERKNSDSRGEVKLRGFKGQYAITVTVDGESHSVDLSLKDDMTEPLEIRLD